MLDRLVPVRVPVRLGRVDAFVIPVVLMVFVMHMQMVVHDGLMPVP